MNRLWKILPTVLFTAVLLFLIALFGMIGAQRAQAPARPVPVPEPEPQPAPEPAELVTAETQIPWNRLTDLRRVTLISPEPAGEVWFEYPVFLPEGEGYEAINAFFRQMCEDYFSPENEALSETLASGEAADLRTRAAGVEFTGVLITVTLDREGAEEKYLFRADTGERLDPADAEGEEFTGPPWTPELQYRTTVSEDREAGVRRTTLDPQGLDLEIWFEVPLLEGDGRGERAVNEFFQNRSDQFFASRNRALKQAWEYAAYPDAPTGTYFYQCRAQTRCRTERLFSVSIGYEWYMGGVADYGGDSYTFRMDTGSLLRLTDVAEEEKRELKAMILAAAEEQDGGTGAIDLDRMAEYDLDDFEFYVEDGSIFISFDKYELTDGAYGGFTLRIPATIREEYL